MPSSRISSGAIRGLRMAARRLWRIRKETSGGVAVLTALCLPAILVVSMGAIQLNAVYSAKTATQDIADSAALWGAQQLGLSPTGVEARAASFADVRLTEVKAGSTVHVTATVIDPATLKVEIDTNRPSFFMNLFPAGGFNTHAEATAKTVLKTPLCVLVFGGADNDNLKIKNQSSIEAGGCLVHSNQNITVDGGAMLKAMVTQTSGVAAGPITPSAQTGAPEILDPFIDLDLSFPVLCSLGKDLIDIPILISMTMPPGLHCGKFRVFNGVTLTLAPGDHYFGGDLRLEDSAKLIGDDVAVVFDNKTKFDFKDNATVSLNGRRSGPLAGFVIAANRTNDKDFRIESDHVSNLLGTVYIPKAKLIITGQQKVADKSAWTVITARAVELQGSPDLVINANYASSDVPVPTGVGPSSGGARIVQ